MNFDFGLIILKLTNKEIWLNLSSRLSSITINTSFHFKQSNFVYNLFLIKRENEIQTQETDFWFFSFCLASFIGFPEFFLLFGDFYWCSLGLFHLIYMQFNCHLNTL